MNPINTHLVDLGRLRRTNALYVSARVEPKQLSPILRNRMIRSIKQAYIPTNAYWGVGLLTKHILNQADVFFVYSKLRGNIWVGWSEAHMRIPPAIEQQFKEIFEADRTATQVAGINLGGYYYTRWENVHRFMPLHILKPQQHILPIMIEYAENPKYQAKVAPYLELIEAGKPIDFTVL